MPSPKAYALPVTAPFGQWSHLKHDGRSFCAVHLVLSASTFPPPPSRKATKHLRRYWRQGLPGKLELSIAMRLFAAWCD